MTGSTPDTIGFVRYLDQQIAQSVLATVLNLDASPNGSRALGETLIGLLQLSWVAVARELTSVMTKLSIQMVDFNWGEDEAAPRIIAIDINRPDATVEAITQLINAKAITPDPGLEASLRDRLRLPQQLQRLADDVAGQQNVSRVVQYVQDLYLGVGTILTAKEARELLNKAGANLTPEPDEELIGRPEPYQAVPAPQPVPAEVPSDAKVVPSKEKPAPTPNQLPPPPPGQPTPVGAPQGDANAG